MKKRYTSKKRGPRRYKRKGKSSRGARQQQKSALTYVKKKYTRVFQMEPGIGTDYWYQTISLVGGRNVSDPVNTKTLFDNNQDNQMTADMLLYQFFKISGVAIKYIFPMPTSVDNTPVQWVSAYSASDLIAPNLPPSRLQTLAAYQTSSCDSAKPISRYYNTKATLKRFGIDYVNTSQFNGFDGTGPLYGTQLPQDQGSSVNVKVYRASSPPGPTVFPIGRLQVTYYVTYKGNKGVTPINAV